MAGAPLAEAGDGGGGGGIGGEVGGGVEGGVEGGVGGGVGRGPVSPTGLPSMLVDRVNIL